MIISKRTRYYAWCLLLVANVVDVLASRWAFEFGAEELNPLAAMLLSWGGLAMLVWFKGVCLVILLVSIPYMTAVWIQFLFLMTCVVYVCLVAYHITYMNSLGWF